jgi:hypothetical protein
MKKVMVAAAAAMMLSMPYAAPVHAQSTYDDAQVLLAQIQADRRAIVLKGLDLTDAEVASFSPIYDEYQRENKMLAERYMDLINTFSANYASMTDDAASGIMKDWFKLVDDRVSLTRKYAKKLEKAIPAAKVLRWVQIENKMTVLTNFEAARIIPLVK